MIRIRVISVCPGCTGKGKGRLINYMAFIAVSQTGGGV